MLRYTMLEKQYAKDGVKLDAEALVHELKRDLHYVLFEGLTVMRDFGIGNNIQITLQNKLIRLI